MKYGRYQIVKEIRPSALTNIETTELFENIHRYVVEHPHLNLIKSHWSENENDTAEDIFKNWNDCECDKTIDLIGDNRVRVHYLFVGECIASLDIEIQPSFVKQYLDYVIRKIAEGIQKQNDRIREENRIKKETDAIMRNLYQGNYL